MFGRPLALWLGSLWLGGAAVAADIAVIVHPDNPVQELSLRELRAIARCDQTHWDGVGASRVYLRATESLEMQILMDVVYLMDRNQLRRLWVQKLYRGELTSKPAVVPTALLAGVSVRKAPGGISFVLADQVPDGVAVLRIDGRLPGEAGYPLTDEAVATAD